MLPFLCIMILCSVSSASWD